MLEFVQTNCSINNALVLDMVKFMTVGTIFNLAKVSIVTCMRAAALSSSDSE